jgi:hypothetical protein
MGAQNSSLRESFEALVSSDQVRASCWCSGRLVLYLFFHDSLLKPVTAFSFRLPQVKSIQDDEFWEKLWSGPFVPMVQVTELLPMTDVRKLKESCPKNLSTLVRRAVLKLHAAANTAVASAEAQTQVSRATLHRPKRFIIIIIVVH